MGDTADVSDFHLVAFVILRGAQGRVLLARRAGVSYANGEWGLPGGHVEPDESLAAAAARETWEEIGVEIATTDLAPIGMIRYAEPNYVGLDVYFAAGRWRGEPRPVSECDAVEWYDVEALPDDVVPWLPAAFQRLLVDAAWYTDLVTAGLPE